MPLPRYNPSEVQLQPGAASVAYEAQANSWNSLTQKLGQFSNMIYGELAKNREREASEQAVIDVANGNMKKVGDFTIYDKAYKDASRSAFITKTEVDAKKQAETLFTQIQTNEATKNNPDAFANIYNGYVKGILAEAPDEVTRATIKQSIMDYGSTQYNKLALAKYEADFTYNKQAFEDGVQLYEEDYRNAVASGDQAKINIAANRLVSHYEGGVANKFVSPEASTFAIKKIDKESFIENSLQGFRDAKDKDRFKLIKKFRNNTKLTSDETADVVAKMHKIIESEYNDHKLQQQKADEAEARFNKVGKKRLNKKLVDGTLTEEDISSALSLGIIGKSDYDDYSQRLRTPGIGKDMNDDAIKIMYMTNIEAFDEDTVYEDNRLSYASKKEIVSAIQSYNKEATTEEEKLSKWGVSVKGKEAIRRIKNEFKILDGQLLNMDMNNETVRDYNIVRTALYDQVEGLPLDQRINKSLEYANRIIKEYKEGQIMGTKPYAKKVAEESKYTNNEMITQEEADRRKKEEQQKKNPALDNLNRFIDANTPDL